MKKKLAAMAVVIGLMFSGCGAAAPDSDSDPVNDSGVTVSVPGNDVYMTRVTVEGTDCIVAKSNGNLSISCDWTSNEIN